MSIQTKPGDVQEHVSDKEVEKFLKQHPDFFEKHTQLLTELKVPHVTGGAVSLVERQVDVLRKQNRKLQKQLDDIQNAQRVASERDEAVDRAEQAEDRVKKAEDRIRELTLELNRAGVYP